MKKSTLLKSALTVMAAFCLTGAMAQTAPTSIMTDYEEVDETIYQTTGVALRLYALPDLNYSPSYNATDNSGLNTMSQWRWVNGDAWATGTELKTWINENFVTVTPAADMTVRVKERFNVAGACESAAEQTKAIKVVGVPSIASITPAANGDWQGNATDGFTYCGEGIGHEITVAFTETGVLPAMAQYTYGVTDQSSTGDANGTFTTFADDAAINLDVTAMAAGTTIIIPALNMKEVAGVKMPTKYTFQITDGSLVSMTSKVSYYRAGATHPTDYVVPSTVISYTLYPTPTTGPIYHIPNSHF